MFKQIGDLNVHYEVHGDGYPLILLHGGGSRAQTFEEMAPILAKSFRVYTFDMRGFGETKRPADPKLSHELWRTDLLRFLDAFGLEKVVLGGWSLGAGVSLNFTIHHPGRVSHLVLIGAMSPRLESSDRSGFQRRRELIEKGATPEEIVAATFEFTKKAFSPYTIQHKPQAVEALRQEHLRNNPAYYLEMLQANENRPKIGDRLGEVRCPTLIVAGEHDGRTPLAMSEDLNKAIPSSLMKIIPNCGHFYSYEHPELVSNTILTYLEAFGAKRKAA
jgi:pimeloyl-ACP methyl ester carboxylesterase